ncbi:hypothetical protein POM88_042209 [Heracleum sosnowskyi]|uniref:Ubiquitin-like protease family profile domain-containing protein n=1 Tax=Heracleum sosnowskyi TaxID=360622 RepID=A0AAD8MC03_9APIA|nr:hypothetical protein POM88_042209 [Heracleum sosnowskyi]
MPGYVWTDERLKVLVTTFYEHAFSQNTCYPHNQLLNILKVRLFDLADKEAKDTPSEDDISEKLTDLANHYRCKAKKMDNEKLEEICKRMDTVESKTTDVYEKLSSDIAELKGQLLQVPKTESQPQTLTPGVNESFFPSRQLLRHPLEERGSSDMETWLKKEFTDQMVLLGNRYFNCSDTNELITKVGTELESYFHSIAPPPQSLSVLIPIIESGHYFSIHIHVNDHCIYILDPLYVDINEDHRKHLTYVVNILIGSKKFLDNAWNSYYVKNNPKQENVFDCGIYIAKYMEYWGKNEKLPFNKEQSLVARHIFVWESVHKKFMDLKYLPDA